MKIEMHNADCRDINVTCDLIFTDPPFEMHGSELSSTFETVNCDHLMLLTTLKQYTELVKSSDWDISFDFVIDSVTPKKSMSVKQPHYTHVNAIYLTRRGAKSIFNRKLRQRSDTFDGKGYWPTILHAPRGEGYTKNLVAIIDILGSFDAGHVYDPFAGSGTTALAAFELQIKKCTIAEICENNFKIIENKMQMLNLADVDIH